MAMTMPISMTEADSKSCAGEVTASQCWESLASDASAQLIDVRSVPEWVFAGIPNLDSIGKIVHTLSWKIYPSMEVNSQFVSQLSKAIPDTNAPLFFLCKTGGRSLDAAITATQAGYLRCYNVLDGFEGPANNKGQRGMIAGWKSSQLDWEQQ